MNLIGHNISCNIITKMANGSFIEGELNGKHFTGCELCIS